MALIRRYRSVATSTSPSFDSLRPCVLAFGTRETKIALTQRSPGQTHLFLHHILRFHLDRSQSREAVLFASQYSHLIYFPHALEVLLHDVLEDEVDESSRQGVLPRVVDFLDHFEECLQVVVNCARKTEVTRWEFLFDVVGKPRDLFEVRVAALCLIAARSLTIVSHAQKCIAAGFLKVAASYLLVLHNLEPLSQSSKASTVLPPRRPSRLR